MGPNLLFGTVAKLNNASHHLFQQDSKEELDLELSEKLHVTWYYCQSSQPTPWVGQNYGVGCDSKIRESLECFSSTHDSVKGLIQGPHSIVLLSIHGAQTIPLPNWSIFMKTQIIEGLTALSYFTVFPRASINRRITPGM